MMRALRIETVRGRLTAFYITVLAAALIIVGGLIYVLLARALYVRIDDGLYALVQITITSLTNDLAEGQDIGRCGEEHRGRIVLAAADAGYLRRHRQAAGGGRARSTT